MMLILFFIALTTAEICHDKWNPEWQDDVKKTTGKWSDIMGVTCELFGEHYCTSEAQIEENKNYYGTNYFEDFAVESPKFGKLTALDICCACGGGDVITDVPVAPVQEYVIKDGPGMCITVTLEHCRLIADVNVGAPFEEDDPSVPVGCYKWSVDGKFYFNHQEDTNGICESSTICYCQAPETETPETETPETEAPETETPVTEAPVTEAPDLCAGLDKKQCRRRKQTDNCIQISKTECASIGLLTTDQKNKMCNKKGKKHEQKCKKVGKKMNKRNKFGCVWDGTSCNAA